MFSLNFSGFKTSKCKAGLSQSLIRIDILRNKRVMQIKKTKIAVANLLQDDKVEKARLEAEKIVRDDFMIEAYDILTLMCELLRDNMKLIEFEKECPHDLLEAVATVLYSCDRLDIPELKLVKDQLLRKYNKDSLSFKNFDRAVNERVKSKISAERPNAYIVLNYLKEIAHEKGIDWKPDEVTEFAGLSLDKPMISPDGSSVLPGSGSGLGNAAYVVTDGRITKPKDNEADNRKKINLSEADHGIKQNDGKKQAKTNKETESPGQKQNIPIAKEVIRPASNKVRAISNKHGQDDATKVNKQLSKKSPESQIGNIAGAPEDKSRRSKEFSTDELSYEELQRRFQALKATLKDQSQSHMINKDRVIAYEQPEDDASYDDKAQGNEDEISDISNEEVGYNEDLEDNSSLASNKSDFQGEDEYERAENNTSSPHSPVETNDHEEGGKPKTSSTVGNQREQKSNNKPEETAAKLPDFDDLSARFARLQQL